MRFESLTLGRVCNITKASIRYVLSNVLHRAISGQFANFYCEVDASILYDVPFLPSNEPCSSLSLCPHRIPSSCR